jgi:hypothetical protein
MNKNSIWKLQRGLLVQPLRELVIAIRDYVFRYGNAHILCERANLLRPHAPIVSIMCQFSADISPDAILAKTSSESGCQLRQPVREPTTLYGIKHDPGTGIRRLPFRSRAPRCPTGKKLLFPDYYSHRELLSRRHQITIKQKNIAT